MPKDLTVSADDGGSCVAGVDAQRRVGDLVTAVFDLRSRVQRAEGLCADLALEVRECRHLIAVLTSSAVADDATAVATAADEVSQSAIMRSLVD